MAHFLPAAQYKTAASVIPIMPCPSQPGATPLAWSLKRAHRLVFTLGAGLRHLLPLEPLPELPACSSLCVFPSMPLPDLLLCVSGVLQLACGGCGPAEHQFPALWSPKGGPLFCVLHGAQ